MGERVVFAWLPVEISWFHDGYWVRSGRKVWLRKVRRVQTMWHDVFYAEIL